MLRRLQELRPELIGNNTIEGICSGVERGISDIMLSGPVPAGKRGHVFIPYFFHEPDIAIFTTVPVCEVFQFVVFNVFIEAAQRRLGSGNAARISAARINFCKAKADPRVNARPPGGVWSGVGKGLIEIRYGINDLLIREGFRMRADDVNNYRYCYTSGRALRRGSGTGEEQDQV